MRTSLERCSACRQSRAGWRPPRRRQDRPRDRRRSLRGADDGAHPRQARSRQAGRVAAGGPGAPGAIGSGVRGVPASSLRALHIVEPRCAVGLSSPPRCPAYTCYMPPFHRLFMVHLNELTSVCFRCNCPEFARQGRLPRRRVGQPADVPCGAGGARPDRDRLRRMGDGDPPPGRNSGKCPRRP